MNSHATTVQPPITQHDGAVTARGDAVALLYRACLALALRQRRDGVAPTPLLGELHTTLYRATMSPQRHKDDSAALEVSPCGCQHGDWVDTAEAARILSVSLRQAQRLAQRDADLGGRRIGQAWVLPRCAVLALSERRRAAK